MAVFNKNESSFVNQKATGSSTATSLLPSRDNQYVCSGYPGVNNAPIAGQLFDRFLELALGRLKNNLVLAAVSR